VRRCRFGEGEGAIYHWIDFTLRLPTENGFEPAPEERTVFPEMTEIDANTPRFAFINANGVRLSHGTPAAARSIDIQRPPPGAAAAANPNTPSRPHGARHW
jgi:hypothetical protein